MLIKELLTVLLTDLKINPLNKIQVFQILNIIL